MTALWQTNTTLATLAADLRAKRRVVVTTHVKPDGDAVGSTLALVRALNHPQPWAPPNRAEAWYHGPPPTWLREIAGSTPHRMIGEKGPPEIDGVDAVVVLDTGSWAQLEAVQDWLKPRASMVSVVDHHVQGDGDVGARLYIDTGAAAVCQPTAELCRLVLNKESVTALPAEVAEVLYLGLATDTGWFRHSNVNHAVMSLAGELLDAGAGHVRLYQTVEQRETIGRLKLLSRALGTLELHENDRVAVMTLTKRDFAETGAQPGESGGFVDYGQLLPTVLVTALLTEAHPADFGQGGAAAGPLTKISLRSKPGDHSVDVNVVAKAMGGGGHVRAAGARMMRNLEQAKAELIRLVGAQLR